MIDSIDAVVNVISGVLYKPYVVPLILILAGIYFTIRLGLVQVRLFGESIRVVKEKPVNMGAMSSFGALMVSTASRVGTGNIMGVSTALCLGGPGAIFWMWITAILGGASAFVESTLAQIYKKRDENGGSYGGPSYYMQDALGQRWLGVIFAVVLILTYVVGYNMLAAYNTQSTFETFSFYNGNTATIIGAILAVLFAVCVLGGGKIFGGFSGSCIMWGIKRGLYSNEAGMGSAPNAAAAADVSHPAKQGLVQMLSVFIDTLLICSATAFLCLFSGVAPAADKAGAAYVQECTGAALGGFGPVFIAVAVCLFAFTTLLGNYYYTEGCLRFIMKKNPGKGFMTCWRLLCSVLVFVGAIISAGLAWDSADLTQALMVIINVPVILILGKPAFDALKDYRKQRAAGKNPHFKAADIGLTNTECWK